MKPALITGVRPDNIGFAVARRVAQASANVLVADLQPPDPELLARITEGTPVRASSLAVDVTAHDSIERMLAQAFELEPELANLVPCAGISDPARPLDITPERFARVMNVNLFGTFFTVQGFVQRLVSQERSGAVATLSSVSGRTGGMHNGLHYAASKAGVISISRGFARAFGKHGIRVNSVAPGIIDSEMSRQVPGSNDQAEATPLGRWGTIWEVADTVTFLLDDASSYMTGAVLDLNGGQYSA
jgi:NAD(P)-dependent dehydrogenase (short-subunit alcohol dehydrogenase family)